MFAYLVHVPRADGEDDVAGLRRLAQAALDVGEVGTEYAALDVCGQVRGGDAQRVLLARGVDLRQVGDVRPPQLLDEVVEERGRARVDHLR